MLEQIYDEWLAKKAIDEQREEKISISGLGGCIRKLIMMDRKTYKFLPHDKYTLRTFNHGYLIEHDLAKAIESSGRMVAKQEFVTYTNPNGVSISGSPDWIVYNPAMKRNHLVDCKTAKESSFQYLDKESNEIKEDYKYQTTTYFWGKDKDGVALKDKYKLNPSVIISTVSKDNTLFYEASFNAIDFKVNIDRKLDEIALARTKTELPPEMTTWNKKIKGVETPTNEPRFPCFAIQNSTKTRKPCDCKIWCNYLPNCTNLFERYKQTCKDMGFKLDDRLK